MSDLNQCQFIGRLGDNPTMRQTQNGEPMATFSIAVSEKWTDKQGNRQEKTEWVNITAFGKLAQIMGQYLTKGSQVFIQGKFTTRKYTDNNGIERYATSIQASQMQMLGGSQNHQQTGQGQQGYPQAQYQPPQQQFAQQPAQGQYYATTADGQPIFPPQPIGQPKAITPPMGGVPDDCPF